MRSVTDDERRARLAVRHALAPSAKAASVEAAARAVTVLHATEPATVYLSCWARVPGVAVADIDRALYVERSVVKQLAMRRTLFAAPRDLLPFLLPSASARVAKTERARMARDIVEAGLAADGDAWVDRARNGVLAALDGRPDGLTAVELRALVPEIDARVEVASAAWTSSRVLVQLGASGDIARAANTGHWRTARPRWTRMANWVGDPEAELSPEAGYRELVRRWLFSFGPGTEADLVWWLGGTKATVRAALSELEAVTVRLDDHTTGLLLPDDLDEVADPGPWVALLPVLDPTVMGWRGREFYLGAHHAHVFDTRGNAGTTAWANGRIVGCWTQDAGARVHLHLTERVSATARKDLDREAKRLTAWLDGVRVGTVYPSPAMKAGAAAIADPPSSADLA